MKHRQFAGVTLETPTGWRVDQTDHMLAAVVSASPDFSSTLVLTRRVRTADVPPAESLPGAVVLHRGPFDGQIPAEEVIVGYPGPTTPLTAVQLVTDGYVITFTADADHFVEDWSAVRRVLETWRQG